MTMAADAVPVDQSVAATFMEAVGLHQSGRLLEAERRYRDIIARDPRHAAAQTNLGVVCAAQGRLDEAAALYRAVLRASPRDPDTLTNLGNLECAQGQMDRAIVHFRTAIAADPDFAPAHRNLGELLAREGRIGEAIPHVRAGLSAGTDPVEGRLRIAGLLNLDGQPDAARAEIEASLRHAPDDERALCMSGDLHRDGGAPTEAERAYRRAAAVHPTSAVPLVRLATLLDETGRRDEARRVLAQALDIDRAGPGALREYARLSLALGDAAAAEAALSEAMTLDGDDWESAMALADLLYGKGRFDEALTWFERVRALKPNLGEPLTNSGLCHLQAGRTEQALELLLEAATRFPESVEALNGLGSAYLKQGRHTEAMRAHRAALAHNPDNPDTLTRLAAAMLSQGVTNTDELVPLTLRAVELGPDNVAAHWVHAQALAKAGDQQGAADHIRMAGDIGGADHIGTMLMHAGVLEGLRDRSGALAAYNEMLKVHPAHDFAISRAVDLRLMTCDWRDYDEWVGNLLANVERTIKNREPLHVLPQDLHNVAISPALLAAAARHKADEYWKAAAEARGKLAFDFSPRLERWRRGERWKLRIAYAIPYTKFTSFPSLHKGIVDLHDRSRFEVFGYSVRPSMGTEFEDRYRASFDHFRDIPIQAPEVAGRMIADDQIDVLIDVTGHTGINCQNVMAVRAAPVQAEMFGYSYTSGAPYIDYLLTDRVWMQPRFAEHCTERLVFLPDSMMCGFETPVADREFRRAELGLPRDAFVFCNFNQPFKFDPSIFRVWMEILLRVPGSVLWLGAWDDATRANLRREAEQAGVSADRLVFSRIVSHPEHLSRLRLADLQLDNRYHGGGVTTIDGFWAGVPIVTCHGETAASGNGATLATAMGIPEVVTATLEEFADLAVSLAHDHDRYRALREKVERNRSLAPLFDRERYTRHLERAIDLMWEQAVTGRSGNLDVPPLEQPVTSGKREAE